MSQFTKTDRIIIHEFMEEIHDAELERGPEAVGEPTGGIQEWKYKVGDEDFAAFYSEGLAPPRIKLMVFEGQRYYYWPYGTNVSLEQASRMQYVNVLPHHMVSVMWHHAARRALPDELRRPRPSESYDPSLVVPVTDYWKVILDPDLSRGAEAVGAPSDGVQTWKYKLGDRHYEVDLPTGRAPAKVELMELEGQPYYYWHDGAHPSLELALRDHPVLAPFEKTIMLQHAERRARAAEEQAGPWL